MWSFVYGCNNSTNAKKAHFPTLPASQPNEATMYVAFVGQLWEQFKTRFADLHANNQAFADLHANNRAFALFATLFAVTMDSVAIHLQIELINLQCSIYSKTKFTEVVIVKFYQQYVPAN